MGTGDVNIFILWHRMNGKPMNVCLQSMSRLWFYVNKSYDMEYVEHHVFRALLYLYNVFEDIT